MESDNPPSFRRLALWSGPRNLSTALMRSFSSREDCSVTDEPFYAAYLARTGLEHPGREDILSSQPMDWHVVARQLTEDHPPLPRPLWYQKHMAHHMSVDMLGPWLDKLDHAFLIRHPARVITSYMKIYPHMTLEETGLPWQAELYEQISRTREAPAVIDASQIRAMPEEALKALCASLGIDWDPAMLRWQIGPRHEDGVWAPYWYESIYQTTGFVPEPEPEAEPAVPAVDFYEEALELYRYLARHCPEM